MVWTSLRGFQVLFGLKTFGDVVGLTPHKLELEMASMTLRLIHRVVTSLRLSWLKLSYNYDELALAQNSLFADLGFDRGAALDLLRDVYDLHPSTHTLLSEHHTLFSALSIKGRVCSVLEIGTYSASCTKLLSVLFPDAAITTVDLPDDDPVFSETYDRGDREKRANFINERNKILATCENVKFVQKNSLHLLHQRDKKYDLIWVDGAHGYPVVAMDILNSLACLSKEGSMFIDDVWVDRSDNDPNYRSVGAYESVLALKDAGLINFALIPKRIEFPHGKGQMKKYIARVVHR